MSVDRVNKLRDIVEEALSQRSWWRRTTPSREAAPVTGRLGRSGYLLYKTGPLSDVLDPNFFTKAIPGWVDDNAHKLSGLASHHESPEEDIILSMLDEILTTWVERARV